MVCNTSFSRLFGEWNVREGQSNSPQFSTIYLLLEQKFPKHIQFSTIYLLLEQKLILNNHYEQKITMIYFIQANGHDTNIHDNIQGMNMYEFFVNNFFKSFLLRILCHALMSKL
jgi:hypothetical protein